MAESASTTAPRGLLCAGLDISLGVRFVQDRLALFGKTIFLLALGYYVFGNGPLLISGSVPVYDFLFHPGSLIHLGAAVVLGGLWWVARQRPRSPVALGFLDAGALLFTCGAWSLMTMDPSGLGILPGLLATTLTVVARAILVPSTGTRTFWLTVVASAFNIALSRLLPPRLGPFRTGREATAFTRLVVAWALCEAAALFPLVVWIVSGDPRLLGVCAVDLIALLTLYPSDARWESLSPPESTGSRSLR